MGGNDGNRVFLRNLMGLSPFIHELLVYDLLRCLGGGIDLSLCVNKIHMVNGVIPVQYLFQGILHQIFP